MHPQTLSPGHVHENWTLDADALDMSANIGPWMHPWAMWTPWIHLSTLDDDVSTDTGFGRVRGCHECKKQGHKGARYSAKCFERQAVLTSYSVLCLSW